MSAEIKDLLTSLTEAWNSGDAAAYGDSIVTFTAVSTPGGRRFASFQNTRVSRP